MLGSEDENTGSYSRSPIFFLNIYVAYSFNNIFFLHDLYSLLIIPMSSAFTVLPVSQVPGIGKAKQPGVKTIFNLFLPNLTSFRCKLKIDVGKSQVVQLTCFAWAFYMFKNTCSLVNLLYFKMSKDHEAIRCRNYQICFDHSAYFKAGLG